MSDIKVATGRVVEILKKDATANITAFRLQYNQKRIRCIYGKDVPIDRQIVRVVGMFITDPTYGEQFKVFSLSVISKDKPALKTYLMDSMFTGIGAKLVEKIVNTFGSKTLNVIRDNSEKLVAIKGITLTKAKSIHDTDNIISKSPRGRLLNELISTESEQLQKIYGTDYEQILRNPYEVIYRNSDISLDQVDEIALKTGVHLDSDNRIGACLFNLLLESQSCYSSIEALQKAVQNKYKSYEIDISADKVIQVINNEVKRKNIVNENGKIYHPAVYDREISLCQMICDMISSAYVFPISSIEHGIEKTEAELSSSGIIFSLDDEQKQAIETSLKSRLSIITGGPGTGKSTVIKALINGWVDCNGKKSEIYLYAPTGKAARRMSSVTGYPAETIHRSLWRRKNPAYVMSISPHSLIIIDECSMMDLDLAYEVVQIVYNEGHTLALSPDPYLL